MKKWIKRSLLSLLAVFLVLVTVAVIFLSTFDPNERRDEIIALVSERTGRSLQINGEMQLSYFPWLGFSVADIELGNAPGFEDATFARVNRAEARVRLWPLLIGNIEVGDVVLDGLELNLARRKDGRSNWDDLLGTTPEPTAVPSPSTPAAAEPPAARAAYFTLGGLKLRNTRIRWDDEQAGQHLLVERLDVETGAIAPDTPFDLSFDTAGRMGGDALIFTLSLNGRFQLAPEGPRVRITALEADGTLDGSQVPGTRPQPLTLRAKALALDLAAEHHRIEALQLRAAGLELNLDAAAKGALARAALEGRISLKLRDGPALAGLLGETGVDPTALEGTVLTVPFAGSPAQSIKFAAITLEGPQLKGGANLEVQGLSDSPRVSGQLRLAEFNPRQLLAKLKLPLPATTDPAALTRLAVQTRLRYGDDTLTLEKLKLVLDDTEARATLRVTQLADPAMRGKLEVNTLNLDRYLPPAGAAPAPAAAPGDAPTTPAAAAPSLAESLAPLRSLNLNLVLGIGSLQASNVHVSRINTVLAAQKGVVALKPVKAALYGGRYDGTLHLRVGAQNVQMGMIGTLAQVDTGPLSKDLFDREWLTGRGDVRVDLTTRGADIAALKAALNGKASLSLKDGKLMLFDTHAVAAYAKAKIKKQPTPPKETLYRPSSYQSLTATAVIENGLITNRDLLIRSPNSTARGGGTVNLPQETLDYRLQLVYGKDTGKELEGLPMVVTVSGPLSAPHVRFGWDELIKAWLKREVERKKKAKEDEIRERIRQKAKDLLKGLGG